MRLKMRCLEATGILLVLVVCIQYTVHVTASALPEASQVISNEIRRPGILEVLAEVIKESRGELAKAKSLPVMMKKPVRKTLLNPLRGSVQEKATFRGELLRQELARETQDNCLAKLLCGTNTNNQKQPGNSTAFTPINDYAFLVKEFFEFFGVDDPTEAEKDDVKDTAVQKKKIKKKKEDDDDDEDKKNNDDDDEEEEDDSDGRRSGDRNIVNLSSNSLTDSNSTSEDVITTSTSATVSSVTTGATITEMPIGTEKFNQNETKDVHKVTLEELVGDVRLTSQDLSSMRQSKGLKLSMGGLYQSEFIHRKLRELRLAKSDSKKLRIAGQIATSIRQPRQCREFNSVASQVLSTCPLTTEVVRYFNSNLKNGSQIAVVKNPPIPGNPRPTPGAGLVVLNHNNHPQTFFLDNSPIVGNTRINTDLKNPTVPERYPPSEDYKFQIYENAFPPKKDVDKVKLVKNPDTKDSAESGEDEDDEDTADDINEEGGEDDDEENDDDTENDDEGSNNESYEEDRNRKFKIKKKPKKSKASQKPPAPVSPSPPLLPPGMIKVYGIPQPSFDNDFSHIANQIGSSGPVVLFDQDDYDSHIPHPGPPVPPPRPHRPTKVEAKRQQKTISKNRYNNFMKTTHKPQPTSASDEEEDEEDIEDARRPVFNNNYNNNQHQPRQHRLHQQQQGPPPPYLNNGYNSYPAPRPEEYYRHGRVPHGSRSNENYGNNHMMNIRPEPSIRGRLNFIHPHGTALMRPYYPENNYRFLLGKK